MNNTDKNIGTLPDSQQLKNNLIRSVAAQEEI